MCGIFGLINKDGTTADHTTVHSATENLKHRGPDDEGYFFFENIGLGHKRLSIIDLSKNASQPFYKHKRHIIYNGEIYNYKALQSELKGNGYHFTSDSDTEVILSAYDFWGKDMFQYLNGMWAFAMWDETKEELFISRDRYGMKPLYVFNSYEHFSIASEIKAFRPLSSWSGNYNHSNINDFLVNGLLFHNSETFYEQVSQLNPGTWITYSKDGTKNRQGVYFNVPNKELGDQNETKKYKTLFSNAINAHYVSDVEVACALSGGLDSSSIVAESYEQNRMVKTFTYAPSEEKFSEYKYVELLKDKLRFENTIISPDFEQHLAVHKESIIANEAPALSMNLMSSFLLYKSVADKGIKVLLAGQGADELLLGYSFYYASFLRHLAKTAPLLFFNEMMALVFKYPLKVIKVLKRGLNKRSYGEFVVDYSSSKEELFSSFDEIYDHYLSYGQLHGLLQFEDRLSMAHSIEGRLPFLDRDFSSFLRTIPAHKLIVSAIRKMPLRKAMKDILPSEIINRKDKMGYLSPQETWIYEYKDIFLSSIEAKMKAHPGWLKKEALAFIKQALNDKKHHGFIWRVYSFYEYLEIKL